MIAFKKNHDHAYKFSTSVAIYQDTPVIGPPCKTSVIGPPKKNHPEDVVTIGGIFTRRLVSVKSTSIRSE